MDCPMSSYRSVLIDSDRSFTVCRRRLEERAIAGAAGASSVGGCGAIRPGTSTRPGRRSPGCRTAAASDGYPKNRCAVSASAVAPAERSGAEPVDPRRPRWSVPVLGVPVFGLQPPAEAGSGVGQGLHGYEGV